MSRFIWPRAVAVCLATLTPLAAAPAAAQEAPAAVTYPTADGGTIHAELYGEGSHVVLLAHGRIFNNESWEPLARQLEIAGYRVLAIDFRGYGDSTAGSDGNVLELDILGGVRYLHEQQHAVAVSVIGGSMGGGRRHARPSSPRPERSKHSCCSREGRSLLRTSSTLRGFCSSPVRAKA
jgi:predicted alpha/beta hydrolase